MIVSLASPNFLTKEHCEIFKERTGQEIYIPNNPDDANAVIEEAEIIITGGHVDGNLIKKCKNLKWVFNLSAGVEGLPFDEFIEKDAVVSNTRGIHARQMAEQTLGMMIHFSRKLNDSINNQQKKKWEHTIKPDELTDKTLCIIGAGSVGKEIARKAKAFDMYIIGLKNSPQALENFDEVHSIDHLMEVLKRADYTVLITPLTSETYHMLGINQFKGMKKDSIFINMSRGDCVHEAAMIEALQKGYIAGAGLDVFHEEPMPESSPLWEMKNVIITPHYGGASPNTVKRAVDLFIRSYDSYIKGEAIPNQVNLKKKY